MNPLRGGQKMNASWGKVLPLYKKKFQVREEKASQLASEQIVLSGELKASLMQQHSVAAKKVAR